MKYVLLVLILLSIPYFSGHALSNVPEIILLVALLYALFRKDAKLAKIVLCVGVAVWLFHPVSEMTFAFVFLALVCAALSFWHLVVSNRKEAQAK